MSAPSDLDSAPTSDLDSAPAPPAATEPFPSGQTPEWSRVPEGFRNAVIWVVSAAHAEAESETALRLTEAAAMPSMTSALVDRISGDEIEKLAPQERAEVSRVLGIIAQAVHEETALAMVGPPQMIARGFSAAIDVLLYGESSIDAWRSVDAAARDFVLAVIRDRAHRERLTVLRRAVAAEQRARSQARLVDMAYQFYPAAAPALAGVAFGAQHGHDLDAMMVPAFEAAIALLECA